MGSNFLTAKQQQRASPSIFSIHSVMALVIGWKLMSPISPLCLCHHLVSKSQQEFRSKKCDSVIANLNIHLPKICSRSSFPKGFSYKVKQ